MPHIKVKNCKTIDTTLEMNQVSYNVTLPVVEAELVLVESTKEDSDSVWINKWVKPILISKTEQLQIGDYLWDAYDRLIYIYDEDTDLHGHLYKILVLPQHFSLDLVQDIFIRKFKDEEKVYVECEMYNTCEVTNEFDFQDVDIPVIKLRDNYITLHKISDKTEERKYSEHEVLDIIRRFYMWLPQNNKEDLTIKGWFEQNIKQ